MFESILCQVTEYDPDVLESLIELAVEIAREGREGRRVGTLFTLGDEMAVLAKSRPLILDPFWASGVFAAPHQSESPRNDQGIGAAGRWVRG
jgi:DNA integrity scanning protein DisA with diadenylate cyclase activity